MYQPRTVGEFIQFIFSALATIEICPDSVFSSYENQNPEWKKLYRKTKHTHNPVDDAIGNAEALLAFKNKLGLKINLI
jgi:hypothetical protein